VLDAPVGKQDAVHAVGAQGVARRAAREILEAQRAARSWVESAKHAAVAERAQRLALAGVGEARRPDTGSGL